MGVNDAGVDDNDDDEDEEEDEEEDEDDEGKAFIVGLGECWFSLTPRDFEFETF